MLFALQYLLTAVVTAVCNDSEICTSHCFSSFLCHRNKRRSIIANVGHLVRRNKMMLRIDRSLYVVGYDWSLTTTRRHTSRIWISQAH